MPLDSPAREPMPRAERGRLGARKRWGPPRNLRLDQLNPTQRRLVMALLDLGEPDADDRPAA